MASQILRPNSTEYRYLVTGSPDNTNLHNNVDEVTPDDDLSGIKANSTLYNGIFRLGLPDPGLAGLINSVTLYVRGKGGATGDIYSILYTHSTTYKDAFNTSSGAYQTFSYEYTTNPYTGLAWTWAEIDALQIGADIDDPEFVGDHTVTQVYIDIDYTPAVGRGRAIIIA